MWKIAALATVAGLVAAAGTWWARGDTVSDQVTGLDLTGYTSYSPIGCSNWREIQLSSVVTADRAACADLCDSTEDCTMFNWQAVACEPGWYVNNGCMLMKGSCSTERNPCWELNWKTDEPATIVTQTVSMETSATAEQAELAVKDALAKEDIEPVETTVSEVGRRLKDRSLNGIRTIFVAWRYLTYNSVKADAAYDYAVELWENTTEANTFSDSIRDALPDGTIYELLEIGEPTKECGGTTETPDVQTTV